MEYWQFLGCYCDLSQPTGLQKLEVHLAKVAASVDRASPLEPSLSPKAVGMDLSETIEPGTVPPDPSSINPSTCNPGVLRDDTVTRDLQEEEDEEVISHLIPDRTQYSSSQCFDGDEEGIVSALTGLTLKDDESKQQSEDKTVGESLPPALSPPVLGGYLTPVRGVGVASRKTAMTRKDIYITG